MTNTNSKPRFLSTLFGLGLLAAAPVAHADESCHLIRASASGQDHGDLTTDAVISDGGLLQGTAHTEFSPTGFEDNTMSFVGTITITAKRATLVVEIAGSFDVATGEFDAVSTKITGTGKLLGARGSLDLHGVEDLATGKFTETLGGELCVDLAR